MKGKIVLCFAFLLLSISFVFAADVAYVYKTSFGVDQNIIDVFEDNGLTVGLVHDNNVATTDFSNYKILFVGDQNLRHEDDVPIGELPTIIANYYHGEIFGLTDFDGISKLASNAPLEVKRDGNIVQVYTQARYSVGGISIPYYYLSDENKAPGMISEARTYVGINSNSDLGDVISYADVGTQLVNGHTTKGKVCFFGIVESDFWTPAARNMFDDCIGYVGMVCERDSDCPDIETGDEYCSNGDVYQDVEEYECENPGTVQSQCARDVVPNLVEECAVGCLDGECLEMTDCQDNEDNDQDGLIDSEDPGCWDDQNDPSTYDERNEDENDATSVCSVNSDCGTDGLVGVSFCTNDDVYQDYRTYTCNNPGLGSSSCSNEDTPILVEVCDNVCSNGACVDLNECQDGSDNDLDDLTDCEDPGCWTDVNNPLTCDPTLDDESRATTECQDGIDNDIDFFSDSDDPGCWADITNPTTYDPTDNDESDGTIICSTDSDCDDSDEYTRDTCVNPGQGDSYCEHEQIICVTESDCGTDGFINGLFCDGPTDDDVFQNYRDWTCENPGTISSSCSQTVTSELITECSDTCTDGACIDIVCETDLDCDDSVPGTIDVCENPGTIDSYCTHGDIDCSVNSDCGIERFTGGLFCDGNEVHRNSLIFACNNPGQILSYCSNSVAENSLFECEYACTDGTCIRCDDNVDCDDDDGDTVDTCRFGGTLDSYCTSEEIICSENTDCGTDGLVGGPFCTNDDSSQNYRTYTCNNAGTVGSYCTDDDEAQIVEDCDFECSNGECQDGVHDVALVDFSNSVNGIRLEYTNGTDILENPAVLMCEESYKVWINVENEGDFDENVTFNGEVGSVVFNHNPLTDLVPGDDKTKTKTVNFDLGSGMYNLTVEALISLDNDLNDNNVTRQVRITCPVCSTDSDCDDSDVDTEDSCVNPGTENAVCENDPIECHTNIDCGANQFLGENVCTNDDVYDDFIGYTCSNPGTALSECSFLLTPTFVEDCGEDSCSDFEDSYCVGDDVYHSRLCGVNGCEVDACVSSVFLDEDLVEECALGCADGECIESCVDNDDDGYDVCNPGEPGDDGEEVDCNDNNPNVNPGATEVCNQIDDDCDGLVDEGDVCVTYECSDGVNNDGDAFTDCDDPGCWTDVANPLSCDPTDDDEGDEVIICSSDIECGANGLIGELFCSNDDSYDYFRLFNCVNPGTVNSECLLDVFPELVEECSFACSDGECVDECTIDSDCEDNFYTLNYCSDDDLVRDLHDFGCESLECVEEVTVEVVEECSFGCANDECIESCVDDDDDGFDVCNPGDPGDDGEEADCDDSDPNVNPGAIEVCNGIDDDCDGLVDEGVCNEICDNGIDDDGDDLIDGLTEVGTTSGTRTWTKDPFGIRTFVNSKAVDYGFTPVKAVDPVQSALNFDSVTADFVCELAGFNTVYSKGSVSNYDWGRSGWLSCNDNQLSKWNPVTDDFDTAKACDMGNVWLSSLVCRDKFVVSECNDDVDNDGDGDTDFPEDDGCESIYDDSEVAHDPDCEEETPECDTTTEVFDIGLYAAETSYSVDTPTGEKLCEERDCEDFINFPSTGHYWSCGDNFLAKWTGSWETECACNPGNFLCGKGHIYSRHIDDRRFVQQVQCGGCEADSC